MKELKPIEKTEVLRIEQRLWRLYDKFEDANHVICGDAANLIDTLYRRAELENKALTAEQIKQLKYGDTITTIHSGKIRRLDGESFETQSSVWGFGDVADGTVKVYLRNPEK